MRGPGILGAGKRGERKWNRRYFFFASSPRTCCTNLSLTPTSQDAFPVILVKRLLLPPVFSMINDNGNDNRERAPVFKVILPDLHHIVHQLQVYGEGSISSGFRNLEIGYSILDIGYSEKENRRGISNIQYPISRFKNPELIDPASCGITKSEGHATRTGSRGRKNGRKAKKEQSIVILPALIARYHT